MGAIPDPAFSTGVKVELIVPEPKGEDFIKGAAIVESDTPALDRVAIGPREDTALADLAQIKDSGPTSFAGPGRRASFPRPVFREGSGKIGTLNIGDGKGKSFSFRASFSRTYANESGWIALATKSGPNLYVKARGIEAGFVQKVFQHHGGRISQPTRVAAKRGLAKMVKTPPVFIPGKNPGEGTLNVPGVGKFPASLKSDHVHEPGWIDGLQVSNGTHLYDLSVRVGKGNRGEAAGALVRRAISLHGDSFGVRSKTLASPIQSFGSNVTGATTLPLRAGQVDMHFGRRKLSGVLLAGPKSNVPGRQPLSLVNADTLWAENIEGNGTVYVRKGDFKGVMRSLGKIKADVLSDPEQLYAPKKGVWFGKADKSTETYLWVAGRNGVEARFVREGNDVPRGFVALPRPFFSTGGQTAYVQDPAAALKDLSRVRTPKAQYTHW
jgi:hypothetical protein